MALNKVSMKVTWGLALKKVSCALFFWIYDLKRPVSTRGEVKYRYVNCIMDSISFTELLPFIPSDIAEITGDTLAVLPERSFCKSTGEKFPTPILLITAAAYSALYLSFRP